MRAVLLAAFGVLAVAGCGGTKSDTTETKSRATTATAVSAQTSCDALGINTTVGKEGTCVDGGVTLHVVNMGHYAKLQSLNVRLLSLNNANSLGTSGGASATAHGTFAILKLEVVNQSSSPQTLGARQTLLGLPNKRVYTGSSDAENGPDRNSCSSKGAIQPNESQVCDVIFDLPSAAYPTLFRKGGGLAVAEFGGDMTDHPTSVADLRTWNGSTRPGCASACQQAGSYGGKEIP